MKNLNEEENKIVKTAKQMLDDKAEQGCIVTSKDVTIALSNIYEFLIKGTNSNKLKVFNVVCSFYN